MSDLVKCEICGIERKQLQKHIRFCHKIATVDYKERFPNAKIIMEGFFDGINNPNYGKHTLAGSNHFNYGKKQDRKLVEKRVKTALERGSFAGSNNPNYGGKFHGKKWWEIPGKICPVIGMTRSDETNKKNSLAHKKLWTDPNSVYHTDKYWENRRKADDERPNKMELILLNALKDKFPEMWEYTGDYSFRLFNSGKVRNPDFKHSFLKKLIEVFWTSDYRKIRNYGSIRRYRKVTSQFYLSCDYEVLFLTEKDVYEQIDKAMTKVKRFELI
jgi:hypothetical protein